MERGARALFIFTIVFVFFSCLYLVSGIKINEVMHHTNNSWSNEWIEIYNPNIQNIFLINWKIADFSSQDVIKENLLVPAQGFALIVDDSINVSGKTGCSAFNISNLSCLELPNIGSGLNENNETIYLYNDQNLLIDSFSWETSIRETGNSWSFYNNTWQTCSPTPGFQNFCNIENQTQQNDTIINDTIVNNTEINNTEINETIINDTVINTTQSEPYLELSWNSEDIKNKEYFEIQVKAYNLENVWYDLKVYITFKENDTIISETYHANDKIWKSGTYYVLNSLQGSGNKTSMIKVKIKEDYNYFIGDAKIIGKIRQNSKTAILFTQENAIEILKSSSSSSSSSNSNNDNTKSNAIDLNSDSSITGDTINSHEQETINLNPQSSEVNLNKKEIIYESKDEKIKKYLGYGIVLFLIFFIIFLLRKD